jgi:hypothetical protein
VKNQKSLKTKEIDFSPTGFSPTRNLDFSPTPRPVKKAPLRLVKPAKNSRRGRPRNPDLPPSPGKYFYWGKARNGLKLERRKPDYEYVGFIMPAEWLTLRGIYDEEYILKTILAAIRVKRARSVAGSRHSAGVA